MKTPEDEVFVIPIEGTHICELLLSDKRTGPIFEILDPPLLCYLIRNKLKFHQSYDGSLLYILMIYKLHFIHIKSIPRKNSVLLLVRHSAI